MRPLRVLAGLALLALAAGRVVQAMRFTPALLDGTPKKVWIEMPVVFRSW